MNYTVSYQTKDGFRYCGLISLQPYGRGYKAIVGYQLQQMYPENTRTHDELVKAAKYLAKTGAVSTILEPTKYGIILQVAKVARGR